MIVPMVKDEIKKRLAKYLNQFSREDIIYWLTQEVFISDYIIRDNGSLIKQYDEIAIKVLRNLTLEEIRAELSKLRPSENDLWSSDHFAYKMAIEFQRLAAFINS